MSRSFYGKFGFVLVLTIGSLGATQLRADIIVAFNFEELAIGINNSPTPSIGTGTATPLGMTNNFTSPPSVTQCDVMTSNGSSTSNLAWRIRSAGSGNGNGWHQSAPQYSQGAQFSTSTAGYKNLVLTFDWQPTTQGVKHLQTQYSVDGINWNNVGAVQVETVPKPGSMEFPLICPPPLGSTTFRTSGSVWFLRMRPMVRIRVCMST